MLLEALRLWPPAPAFSLRPLREDCVVAGKYLMRKGTRVAVLLPALHRDPEVWSEPEKFDPDRFLPGPVAERPTAAYKPFGNGKRSCIGRRFALVEAQLALSTLVQRYDFELVEEASGMEEMLTLRPARYLARLTRRSTAGASTS